MFSWGNTNTTTTDAPLNSLFKKPCFNDQPPLLPNDSPFFSNFPCPFFDELHLPFNQITPTPTPTTCHDDIAAADNHHPQKKKKSAGPQKRTGNKDRHSKICTAKGVRDRRMRLSLQVARKFFDLQDMLGYDKASKTIEWLFTKSNKAIKDLAAGSRDDVKSESECEVLSEEDITKELGVIDSKKKPNSKESRAKARERARCRTMEKMMIKYSTNPNHVVDDDEQKHKLFDQEIISQSHDNYCHQSSDVGTIEKLLGNSHCSAAAAANTSFMGFLGNWDPFAVNNQLISLPSPEDSRFAGHIPDSLLGFNVNHQPNSYLRPYMVG